MLPAPRIFGKVAVGVVIAFLAIQAGMIDVGRRAKGEDKNSTKVIILFWAEIQIVQDDSNVIISRLSG